MIAIHNDLEIQIVNCALSCDKTPQDFLKQLINDYQQDRNDYLLAEQLYQEFIASGESTISFDQVMKENGL